MNRGRTNRTKWGLRLVILLLTLGFLMPSPTPASESPSYQKTNLRIGCVILGLLASPLIAYAVYENLPSRRGKERLLNGEFYAGGFLGVAFTPSQNLNYLNGQALHIVGRYGFLPDKEVPFGRLQPYVGIGPAFIVLYEEVDSAKNFGIDVMGGVRYMFTKHISAFVEYKYNHQWAVEIQDHPFYLPNGMEGRSTATLDFDCHKVVAGVAYHWQENDLSLKQIRRPPGRLFYGSSYQLSAVSQDQELAQTLIANP